MFVSEVFVQNYRNYIKEKVSFENKTNFLVGKNAQGKTNLLEAIYLCSVGRSARTPRDRELINFDSDRAYVKVFVKKRFATDRVEMTLDKSANKRVAVNGLPITRIGELMGVVTTVFFSPDEMKIVKDGPSDRRRFMDISLCQMSKAYFYLLSSYNKTLSQRNKLLKNGATDDVLDVWDMQLVGLGSKIIKTRRGFVQRLGEKAAHNHSYLTDGGESLKLGYESESGETVEEIALSFKEHLLKDREKDKLMGYTRSGPHKDDIAFCVGDTDIRAFGSQGQQRTAALAVKLAEIDLIAGEKEEYPVLLLDDVLSELDLDRQIRLLNKIKDYQTIITCTHIDDNLTKAIGNYAKFIVENGKVTRG